MATHPPIELGTDELTVRLDPRLGGRIVSVADRSGNEYIERGAPPHEHVAPDTDYLAGGLGGMDDCLPGIGAEVVHDRVVPDHGEVWCRPVSVVERTPAAVTLEQTGITGDHLLRRRLAVDGTRLLIDYELSNLRSSPYDALWAAHPLLPLTPDAHMLLGGIAEMTVYESSFAPAGTTIDLGSASVGGRVLDLTHAASLPDGHALKAFAPLPRGSEVGVLYAERQTRLLFRLVTERDAWLGLWLNAGGFPVENPVRHLALEPSLGLGDLLSEAIANGSCLRLEPHAQAQWRLELELAPA